MKRVWVGAPLVTLALLLTACEKRGTVTEPPDETPPAPVLRNLLVDLAAYDSVTGTAGAIKFDGFREKVFYEFNAKVAISGGFKSLPTFEFHVTPDAPVYVPADGYLSYFKYQTETDDYEMGISRVANPSDPRTGFILIDHVRNVRFQRGDLVTAGQLLGTAGRLYDGLGRVELMVTTGDSAWCPFLYLPDSLKNAYRGKVSRLMSDWEAFKKDTTLYDQAAMFEPGCLGPSGTP